jgi:hypothetical protein
MKLSYAYLWKDTKEAITNFVQSNGQTVTVNRKPYTNLEHIGQGGNGMIYKGLDSSGASVVVKLIQDTYAEIKKEVNTMRYLNCIEDAECFSLISCLVDVSPQRSPVFEIPDTVPSGKDTGKRGPVFAIILKLADGSLKYKTLRQNNHVPSTKEEMQFFIGQYLYTTFRVFEIYEASGLGHNDIKPANMLYNKLPAAPYYNIYISDFGSTSRDPLEPRGNIKQACKSYFNAIPKSIGPITRMYTSPGFDRYSHLLQNDSWAVFVSLYEILCAICTNDVYFSPEVLLPGLAHTIATEPLQNIDTMFALLEQTYGLRLTDSIFFVVDNKIYSRSLGDVKHLFVRALASPRATRPTLGTLYTEFIRLPLPIRVVSSSPKVSPKTKSPPKKKCKSDEILNPATKRCVKKSGKIGKELLKKISPKKSPRVSSKKVSSKQASPKKVSPKKKCKSDEILNPATKRCVKKSGKIGKNLLKNISPKKSLRVSSKKKSPPKKKCKTDEILNPATKRCVKKSGKIGKKLNI